jgi:flagellar hook assembly protein FlgD
LASLIYTAWVQAGSPVLYPNAINEQENSDQPRLLAIFPNPVSSMVSFPVVVQENTSLVTLTIFDNQGKVKDSVLNRSIDEGYHKIDWNVEHYAPGVYYCKLTSGKSSATQRFIITP